MPTDPDLSDKPDGTADDQHWLTTGVASIAAASFFSDAGHEIATSVLPSFVTATLHAGPGTLGAIEGVSDALVGVSKLAGGPLATGPARRARLASGGYLGTAIATAAIGITTAVWQVAILRAAAWISRGIRSPARDSMLTTLTPERAYGRAFGLERAGDNAGAVAGPLLAALLVSLVGIRHAILFALIPGILAAAAIIVAARQARRTLAQPTSRRTLSFNVRELRNAGLVRAIAPAALFEFGNLAATLLILRATDLLHTNERSLTAATSLAILLYAAHNGAATIGAVTGGHLADRLSARTVFTAGVASYAAGYLSFLMTQHGWPLLLIGFILAGVGIGFAETAESTTVAQALPGHLHSNGFGVLGLTQSLGDLSATLIGGLLWALVSPALAFGYAIVWMLASLATSAVLPPVAKLRAGSAL